MPWFDGFEERRFAVNGSEIFARVPADRSAAGKPPLLLLHGFPQSHVMWRRVAQVLQDDYCVVMPDLRGYGDSAKPVGEEDHANYSKRTMAQDMVALMQALGHTSFFLCGHDRGGRVAARLALDHPQCVKKLCVIDIAPTLDMYDATNMAFARAYYHWFHLIQPTPLPETMINACWKPYLHAKLGGWGAGGMGAYEEPAVAEYERHFSKPATIHAMCEDYRASAGIDLEHDRASRQPGAGAQKIACDLLVLWGDRGVVHRMFKPIALWQAQCAGKVTGQAVPAGHFIPEELPAKTAAALAVFME
jgi:haloacetate dehalogenase